MVREDRKGKICDSGEVEDECEFLFQCKRYNGVRTSWEKDVMQNYTDFQN